jgi:hypothetical protein
MRNQHLSNLYSANGKLLHCYLYIKYYKLPFNILYAIIGYVAKHNEDFSQHVTYDLLFLKGRYVQSFRSIAPAVTIPALLTDDNGPTGIHTHASICLCKSPN